MARASATTISTVKPLRSAQPDHPDFGRHGRNLVVDAQRPLLASSSRQGNCQHARQGRKRAAADFDVSCDTVLADAFVVELDAEAGLVRNTDQALDGLKPLAGDL